MSSLYDERNGRVYVPMSLEVWNNLRYGWSEPVQARVDSDETLIFRSLRQTGRLFATEDAAIGRPLPVDTPDTPPDA